MRPNHDAFLPPIGNRTPSPLSAAPARHRGALLRASTALVGLSILTAGIAGAVLWPAAPAMANGGKGSYGAGGVDTAEAAGGNGGNGRSGPFFGGAGGGGAGVTGGNGGAGHLGGAGGAGGTTPGASGSAGADGAAGGGGGGGAHGSVGTALPGTASIGGAGGRGGYGSVRGGGGGGAGGYGAVVTGSGALGSLATSVLGGNGGSGGSTGDSTAGAGGSAGSGLLLTNAAGASLTINAAVRGGNGGSAGSGNIRDGIAGAGGVGLVGQNLSITLGAGGAIAGGLSGDGVTRANALQLSGSSSLSVAASGTAAITGNIAVSGTLTFDQASGVNATIANAITGTGAVAVAGAGTVTLTGANTYAGGTTLAGGTLVVTTNAALGAATGALAFNGGTLRFDAGFNLAATRAISIAAGGGTIDTNGQTTTIAQGITGTGGLRVSGAGGMLLLTGAATHAGGTTIDAGARLQLGTGGTTGSLAGNVVNNGTLAFNRSDTVTFAGAISGTGTVRLEGTGTVVLTGANTFTGGLIVAAGALRIEGSGSIAGTVATDATTVLAQSGRASLGALSGAGDLRQDGTGTTELTGNSSYTGATAVNAGTLVVNGSIATSSGVTVASGGTIGGNATLPSTSIASGGTISPGNSPGTITVQGNLTLDAGSLYIAEVQGAVADRINVTGTASLAGTVRLVPLGGPYTFSSPYTLLSAQGGRSGSFTTVDTAGSFGDGVTSAVTYTATDVLLTLTPKPLTPIIDDPTTENPSTGPRLGLGSPANAHAVAAGIDRAVAAGADPSAFFAIYNLPAAAIPAAVNQLSGEVHTAIPAMAVSAADQFLAAMLDPRGTGRLLGGAAPGIANKAAEAPGQSRYAVWASVFGSTGHSDGTARQGSARRDLDDAHVAVGADIRLDADSVAGFALAFGGARSSLAGGLGKAESDVFQAGLYGMTRLGPVSIAAALGYARIENDVSRGVPVLGGALSSSYATDAWSGRLQASAAVFEQGGFTLSPLLALQATRVGSPTVREAGRGSAGAAALAIAGRDDVTSRGEIGLQLDYAGRLGETALTGHLRAGWAHYFQRDAGLSAAIAGLPGAGFAVAGARGPRNAALLSAGIEASITPAVTISARFDSEIGGSAARYGGTAQIRYSF